MFPDVMCDIETTGTSPDYAAILQIAAVRFNVDTKEVDAQNMFSRSLHIPPGRFWQEDTRQWWMRQKAGVLQNIMARAEKPEVVMNDFAEWAGYSPEIPHRFWSKNQFDFPFVSSYFRQFDIHNPFHFRYAVEMQSFLRGRLLKMELPKSKVEFQGDAHNALFDVLHQIRLVFEGLETAA